MPDEARPSGDNAFKIGLVRRVAVRALRLSAAGTPSLGAAADARRERDAGRQGLWPASFPALMFQGQAVAVLRRDIANAVSHATGMRALQFPIAIEHLIRAAERPHATG